MKITLMPKDKLEKFLSPNKLYILNVYVLTDRKYLYQIMNKLVEEWYLINDNNKIKLNIFKDRIKNNNKRTITFYVTSNDIYLELETNDSDVYLNGKKYSKVFDSYLEKMFFDIFKYD